MSEHVCISDQYGLKCADPGSCPHPSVNRMKIVRYQHRSEVSFGTLLADGRIQRIAGAPLEGSHALLQEWVRSEDVRLLAPLERPRIFGAAFNYANGGQIPELPALFYKPDTCLAGPGDPIVLPVGAENVHYEAELCAIIGKTAREVSEEEALQYVLGYTCGNDVTDRAVQMKETKFGCMFAAKAFETSAPMGPVITTDLDPSDLYVIGRLNGEVRQRGHTSDLLFSVRKLVSYMSSFMTLRPGDVIMTGTPLSTGPLRPGDRFDVEIEGIGVLSNPVVAKSA